MCMIYEVINHSAIPLTLKTPWPKVPGSPKHRGVGGGGELFNWLAVCVGAAQLGVFSGMLGIVQGIFS